MSGRDQELRAIAFLAARCRPAGCKQWDETGIYANLKKVADRSLGSITIAAIQAAEDRNAATPGVIPTPGPHWRAPEPAPTPAERTDWSTLCEICKQPRHLCERRRAAMGHLAEDDPRRDDHEFTVQRPAASGRRDPAATQLIAEAVKSEIQPISESAVVPSTSRVTPGAGRQRLKDTTDA